MLICSAWGKVGWLRGLIAFCGSPQRTSKQQNIERGSSALSSLLGALASRLGLPSKRKSQRPPGFLGVSASQLKQGGSACRSGGGGTPAAAAATGHPTTPRHSPCDSWDSADAERSPDVHLLDNAASGLQAAAPGGRKRGQAYSTMCALHWVALQSGRPAPTKTPPWRSCLAGYHGACSGGSGTTSTEPEGQPLQHEPLPPPPQQEQQQQLKPAAPGFSQPVSDVYELSSSSEDEGDAPVPAGAPALVAAKCAAGPASAAAVAKQDGKLATPASKPDAADCPICSNSLAGLSLEQQQRHINACCDAVAEGGGTKPAAVGLKQLGRQPQPWMPAQDTDTIPAYRPCFQQEQQPPAGVQQQQRGARQLAGAPAAAAATAAAAKAATAAAGCQVPRLPDAAGDLSPQAPEQAAQQQQLCKVCGADLSHLRVQQQVSHVKACMAGRGGKLAAQQQQQQQQQARPPKRQAQQMQPQAQHVLPAQQQKAAVAPQRPAAQQQQKQQQALADGIPAQAAAPAPSSNLREMGIGEWLQVSSLWLWCSLPEWMCFGCIAADQRCHAPSSCILFYVCAIILHCRTCLALVLVCMAWVRSAMREALRTR